MLTPDLSTPEGIAFHHQHIARLCSEGFTDRALDVIYDHVDHLFRRGQFSAVNSLLGQVPIESSSSVLVGYLTATLPAKKKLPLRATLRDITEEIIISRDQWDDGLLVGL